MGYTIYIYLLLISRWAKTTGIETDIIRPPGWPGLTLPTSVSIKHKVGFQSRWSLRAPPPPKSPPSPLRNLPGGHPPSLRKSLQKMKKWRRARPPLPNDHSGVFINLFWTTIRKDSVRYVDGPWRSVIIVSNPCGVRHRQAPINATIDQKLPRILLFSSPGHLCCSEDVSPSWRMDRTLINITCQRQNGLEGRGV